MSMKLNLVSLSFLLLFVSIGKAQSSDGVFDVTKYGAKPDADISQVKIKCYLLYILMSLRENIKREK